MPAMKCFWYPLPHQMGTYRYICTCFPHPNMVISFLYTSYFVKVVVYLRNIFQDQMLVFISFHEVRQNDLHKLWKDLFTSLGLDDKGTELFTQSINQELFKQMLTTLLLKHEKRRGDKAEQFVECLGNMAVPCEHDDLDYLAYTKVSNMYRLPVWSL